MIFNVLQLSTKNVELITVLNLVIAHDYTQSALKTGCPW